MSLHYWEKERKRGPSTKNPITAMGLFLTPLSNRGRTKVINFYLFDFLFLK